MQLVTKKLSEIKPYPNNPRNNDAAVDDVAESIRQCEYNSPIVVDENNVILCGHTRMKALQKLGYEEAEVIVKEGLTEKQKKKYRLLDNQTSSKSEWDYDKLMQELDGMDFEGFDFGFDLDMDEESEAEAVEDDYDEEPPAEPKSKMGDIYQLGRHRLMCGDSTKAEDVERLMGGVSAALCVTDPPYNTNNGAKDELLAEFRPNARVKNSDKVHIANDNMAEEDFLDFLKSAFENMVSSLIPGGVFYVWHASRSQRDFENALNDAGLEVREQLIWVKNHFSLGMQDYNWKHELCFYGWTDGAAHYFVNDRTQSTVLEYDKPMRNSLHPTMKPIGMMCKLIENSSKKGDNVLDLFGGSGSTLMACEQTSRNCFMMEYEPKYIDVIIDRWEKFTGQKAVKIS